MRRLRRTLVKLLLALGGVVMLYAGTGLPIPGDPTSPTATHVSDTYIEEAYKDTKTDNIVTVVLGDYRSFDTFGEVLVVFTAGMACYFVLVGHRPNRPGGTST